MYFKQSLWTVCINEYEWSVSKIPEFWHLIGNLHFPLKSRIEVSEILNFWVSQKQHDKQFWNFRSQANGNCLFSSLSIVLCGDNWWCWWFRNINSKRTLFNLLFFHSKHPCFISLITKYSRVFNTIIATSVSFNDLDSNKIEGELV